MIAPSATHFVSERAARDRRHPIRAGAALDDARFERVRRHLLLRCSKWDPQVGDVATLAQYPLIISSCDWSRLSKLAEELTTELFEAETELLDRPELHGVLGIPRSVRNVLNYGRRIGTPPAAARVMRFDFHWTTAGWQISEVNSDVPGGYAEGSAFPRLMADLGKWNAIPAGDPAGALVDAIAESASPNGGAVGLLAATGYMEDWQVVSHLRDRLADRGVDATLLSTGDLSFRDKQAFVRSGLKPLAAVIRFFQIDWFSRLPRRQRASWMPLFAGGSTPVTNPPCCAFSESKRFPLVWKSLRAKMTTWRSLLPETRDPREVPWRTDDAWLLKSAFCNTGDSVSIRSLMAARSWRAAAWSASLWPSHWVAQRRFKSIPIWTPIGRSMSAPQVHPCIGVYTVNGRCCGAYARLSAGPVVNFEAVDGALLVERESR